MDLFRDTVGVDHGEVLPKRGMPAYSRARHLWRISGHRRAVRRLRAEHEERAQEVLASRPSAKAGHPVFRVKRTRAAPTAIQGMLFGVILGFLVGWISGQTGWAVFAGIACAVTGWIIGGRTRDDYCSSTDCLSSIPQHVQACPGCAGQVSGTIDNPSDRLDALEKLQQGGRPGAN